MLENLVFSLNATMPIFLMMVVGYVLNRIHLLNEATTAVLNKIVFYVFLPALLFEEVAKQDFVTLWDGNMVLFCAGVTIVSILVAALLSFVDKDKTNRGEFIQGSYRSAAATLGIAFMTNIYDNAAMVALMIIGSVPIYNFMAVVILSLTAPKDSSETKIRTHRLLLKTIRNIVTNPIILGIVAGLLWSIARFPQPIIMEKSIGYLGNMASPLALIAVGATFTFSALKKKIAPVCAVVFNKLVLFCVLFLPVAIAIGYREDKLVAILIMLGSGTTSSSFIMAKNMGHEGSISASAVMVTTFLSSFTIAAFLFALRTLGYI